MFVVGNISRAIFSMMSARLFFADSEVLGESFIRDCFSTCCRIEDCIRDSSFESVLITSVFGVEVEIMDWASSCDEGVAVTLETISLAIDDVPARHFRSGELFFSGRPFEKRGATFLFAGDSAIAALSAVEAISVISFGSVVLKFDQTE